MVWLFLINHNKLVFLFTTDLSFNVLQAIYEGTHYTGLWCTSSEIQAWDEVRGTSLGGSGRAGSSSALTLSTSEASIQANLTGVDTGCRG